MGAGGEGAIKKGKKSKAGGDASAKKAKTAKKKKVKGKTSKTKSKKTSSSSRLPSLTSAGEPTTEEEPTDKEEGHTTETDAATLIKPQKVNQTCVTLWSEPTTCCVDLLDKATATPPPCGDNKCRNVCLKLVREEVEGDMEERQAQARLCIERLSNERDYYRGEFERLLRFFEKIGATTEDEKGDTLSCLACQKKAQMIEYLQRENEVLAKEKFCLMSRLEDGGARFDTESPVGKCCKASCKRTERERDLLRLDIQRLEEETDCLREKFKTMSENKTRDYAKFQEQRGEYENVIKKLEDERRELIKAQGIRRVTINALEEKVDMYTNLLRAAQEEIHRLKNQYCQLKKLHEQCDKALLDTQAQLMEVETELLRCQKDKEAAENKRKGPGKDAQVVVHKCPCVDATTEAEKDVSYASEDVIKTIKKLDEDKDDLVNQLDLKTELLFRCQEEAKTNEETIEKLKEEIKNLEEEMKGMEGEVVELKEKFNKSTLIIQEKDTEIKNLQTDNEQKLMDVKKCQTIIEEKEAQNKALQAEVEQLNKETSALATSNHQLQTDSNHSKVQVSVAMETVNELENKTKQLEDMVAEYERQIRLLKNDIEDCRTQVNRKEIEITNLLKNKNSLQNLSEHLDVENRTREKTICDLKCECQKLKTDLEGLGSREKIIKDLRTEIEELRAERDRLEKENRNLKKRMNKLENKLFQCICTICDNAQDKCSMANCLFKEYADISHQRDKTLSETKEVGVQAFCETSIRNMKTCTSSIKQVMAAVPLKDEQSSKVITSLSTLPGASDKCCPVKKDTIISSMYQSVDPATPFAYSRLEEANKKSPLNVIVEEMSSGLFNEEKIEKIHEPEKTSWTICPEVEEREKYIIDNVTSVCKIIQVGTEERIVRRTRVDDVSSKNSSSGPSKNF